MKLGSHLSKITIAALALTIMSQPAAADVKEGVEAWSRGEYDAAVKQWRDPALKGDPDAQFNMGQAYKTGRGVPTDLNVALEWYKKAAAQGHLKAADSYGHLLHYQGKIVDALPILQASSDRGDPRARYLLATELFNGTHVGKDWVRAYALMSLASSSGMTPASESLAQMDKYIPLEQRQAASVLAGSIEQRSSRAASAAGFPINTTPPVKTATQVAVPPSSGEQAAPVKAASAVPPSVVSPWRIQLGAFGEDANAKKLWAALKNGRPDMAALQPVYKATGKITKLQAGPFASKSAADAMCTKLKTAGQACLVVPA